MFRTHTPIHVVALLPLLMLSTGFAEELPAKGMSPLPYGRQELGKETTVKQSLADPAFKLRKLNKNHYIYFKQLPPTAQQVAAMKELKAPEWTVPIIAMTGKETKNGPLMHTAKAFGAAKTLLKPFDSKQLLEAIEDLVEI